jgi:enamine deaminase RidA (YjgF/YER057c/UK114 family)
MREMGRAMEHHVAPEGIAAATGYSHAVAATGRLVAVAGQVALDEDGEVVGANDPEAHAERVFENLRLALAAAGATFADVMKVTYFLTDLSILPVVREVRSRYIDPEQPPASTAVQVVALVRPELKLEIEALAVIS